MQAENVAVILGVPQSDGNHEEAVRKAATTKHLQKVSKS